MRPIDPNSTQQQLLHLSEKSEIPIATLRARLRAGVPFEELTQPQKQGRPTKYPDLQQLADQNNIKISTLRARLRAGVPITAVTQPRKRGRRDVIQKFHHKFWAGEIY